MEQFFGGKDEAGRETSGFFLTSSVLLGLLFGPGLSLKWFHGSIGAGKYGNLLWVNLVGISLCFARSRTTCVGDA